jgi:hypothetical protein
MKTKLSPRVFERAALLILKSEEGCCCWAMVSAHEDLNLRGYVDGHTHGFPRMLGVPKRVKEGRWFWYGPLDCPQSREARILGLLLCAQLVREGFTLEDFA